MLPAYDDYGGHRRRGAPVSIIFSCQRTAGEQSVGTSPFRGTKADPILAHSGAGFSRWPCNSLPSLEIQLNFFREWQNLIAGEEEHRGWDGLTHSPKAHVNDYNGIRWHPKCDRGQAKSHDQDR